jgi:hypothetical protein
MHRNSNEARETLRSSLHWIHNQSMHSCMHVCRTAACQVEWLCPLSMGLSQLPRLNKCRGLPVWDRQGFCVPGYCSATPARTLLRGHSTWLLGMGSHAERAFWSASWSAGSMTQQAGCQGRLRDLVQFHRRCKAVC